MWESCEEAWSGLGTQYWSKILSNPVQMKWPHALKVCKTNKLKLSRKLSQHPLDPNLQIKYRECCCLWNRLVLNHVAEIEKCITESRNLGAFYCNINNWLTDKDDIGAIVTSNNVVLTDDTDKANEFNKYFASVGVVDGNLPNCLKVVDNSICLTSVNIAESDVLFAKNCMKNNFSSADYLPHVLFKQLKQYFPLHCFLISYCLLLLYIRTGKKCCHYTCS